VAVGCSALVASAVLLAAVPAWGEASGAATAQFERGRTLMKSGKFKQACAAFAQSQKLDPQHGTLYNLANCYVKLGKLASAWSAYHDLAKIDTNAKRRADAAKRETELAPRLSKLVIVVDADTPGLEVTMDGLDVTGLINTPTPVDRGTYEIVAKATGREGAQVTAEIEEEGKTHKIRLDLGDEVEAAPKPKATAKSEPREIRDPPPPPPESKSNRRIYGAIAMVGGIALVGTGLVFGGLANSKWDEAKALCGDDLACEDPQDIQRGNVLVDAAESRANLSTGLVIGGAVVLTVGVVLYVTAPSRSSSSSRTAIRISPGTTAGPAGVTIGGHF
jgi:tetratricopeptide (TPR) repeat protein